MLRLTVPRSSPFATGLPCQAGHVSGDRKAFSLVQHHSRLLEVYDLSRNCQPKGGAQTFLSAVLLRDTPGARAFQSSPREGNKCSSPDGRLYLPVHLLSPLTLHQTVGSGFRNARKTEARRKFLSAVLAQCSAGLLGHGEFFIFHSDGFFFFLSPLYF